MDVEQLAVDRPGVQRREPQHPEETARWRSREVSERTSTSSIARRASYAVSASSSSASTSSRTRSAVRASAAATPGPRLSSSDREDGTAHAHPRVAGIVVVRVVPGLDALDLAGGHGVVAGDVEQRPGVVVERAAHAGQRARHPSRGPGRAAPSLPGRHGCGRTGRAPRSGVLAELLEHVVPRLPRGRLRAVARRRRRRPGPSPSRRRRARPAARPPAQPGRPSQAGARGRRSRRPRAARACDPRRPRPKPARASRRRPSRRRRRCRPGSSRVERPADAAPDRRRRRGAGTWP